MHTLAEIETVVDTLPPEDQQQLLRFLMERLPGRRAGDSLPGASRAAGHSVMDIQPVSLGRMLEPQAADDDLLAEMLEGRA